MTGDHDDVLEHGRRRFLKGFSAAALSLAGLGAPLRVLWASEPGEPARRRQSIARFEALELLTSASFASMKAFYAGALGLPVEEGEDGLEIRAGETRILFRAAGADHGAPFYHFAFNIPENKILAAREWQLARSDLFVTPKNLRDRRYPDDVRHFRSWNAHSVFFWDPAGNVLEYIARHDLGNAAPGSFGPGDILCASEMAFVVDDVSAAASDLQTALGLEQYRRCSDQFCALGDELGLLLLFSRGRDIGDRLAGRPKRVSVYPTRARIRSEERQLFSMDGFPYAVEGRPGSV